MQVAVLGLRRLAGATRSALGRPDPWRDRFEDRVEMLHDVVFAPDHQAEAALQPEDAAARADVDVVDALWLQHRGAIDVVAVVAVATVDDDVAGLEEITELVDEPTGQRGRHHQPDGAGLVELLHEVGH